MDNDNEIQELQERIDHLEKLTKDNNRILHTMRNHMRWGVFLRGMWWLFVLGSMLGLYYYLQPFIGQIFDTYNEIIDIPEKIKTFDFTGGLNL
jgi:hypothetical protein